MATDPDIGIVGGGTAGLHLALLLQHRGVGATLYAERTAAEVLEGRLANTVAHHHRTRARERSLGINHWDETGPSYDRHWHYFGGEQPLAFPGDFGAPSLAVDYRIYQSRLLEDFEQRGGTIRFGTVEVADAGRLSTEHDLVVVCTGRGGWSELFPSVVGRSLDAPRRLLSAGLYTGIAYPSPIGVTFAVSPGHGELIEIPLQTFEGNATTLLFETVPGGDLEILSRTPYEDDPAAYERLVLDKLREHFPPVFERTDTSSFGLTRPSSIVQGAIVPTVRRSVAMLDGGTCAIAVGDAHVALDPLVGQGANSASFSTWTLGEAILAADGPFDEAFCRGVDERRLPFVLGAYDWTNFMTAPEPHLFALVGAMSQNPALANDFTENFNFPDRQWEHLASPEATEAYIGRFAAR
jgi:2-polyprenyl-6-methoxyphenol hydroxylase-like FAD-dependent oxidoreductase